MPPKSYKKPIDSKFEFWTKLPIEMQLECIKRMDFKSKMQLRATSKQDKLLVESAPKHHFNSVDVVLRPHKSFVSAGKLGESVSFGHGRMVPSLPNLFERAQQLSISILKFSTAKELCFASNFETDEAASKFLADISKYAPFRFKNVCLYWKQLEIVKFWLKNCIPAGGMKVSHLSFAVYGAEVMDILQLPTVINAKNVYFGGLNTTEITYHFIKKWLDIEKLEAGQFIKFRVGANRNLDFVAEKFQNRVVSKTEKTLRIRTNDSTKHILIRDVLNQRDWGVYSLVVVNSLDQKEPE